MPIVTPAFAGDDALLSRLARAAEAARSAGIDVVHVRVTFRDGYPDVAPGNIFFSRLTADLDLTESNPGTGIHPAMAIERADILVTKRRVNAFAGSDLALVLRSGGIDTLVLRARARSRDRPGSRAASRDRPSSPRPRASMLPSAIDGGQDLVQPARGVRAATGIDDRPYDVVGLIGGQERSTAAAVRCAFLRRGDRNSFAFCGCSGTSPSVTVSVRASPGRSSCRALGVCRTAPRCTSSAPRHRP
ncbi:cysteine hydrolase family protein [Amycolatopsis echigonensis]|uniref:Isochorismatase family protein n=1 Tax=Amycolatopsis echigonensis TaxID=2576905 RepID=A0A8E1VW53_9PSEU|nr:isochorismatase family protein [Amycolatopsis echigonensis]MBB2499311.1 isochorismatase family protein [Amycolatopsis echigonensis]